ncbi:hypothetical protein TrRE_jg6849, partial [Triparma retinervis]
IPCPADPSHTISRWKVDSHLKKCPKVKLQRELESKPYYRRGCNRPASREVDPVSSSSPHPPWSLTGPNSACDLALSIVSAYSSVFPSSIDTVDLSGPEFSRGFVPALRSRMVPLGSSKHTVTSETVTAEKATAAKVKLCMVERGGTKRKADTRVRNDVFSNSHSSSSPLAPPGSQYRFNSKFSSSRIRCDLEHVWMQTVMEGLGGGGALVVAKHLCGQGTDLALRGIGGLRGRERARVKGIAMATCCHGVCDLGALVGGGWLGERVREGGWEGGWGEREFKLMCKWTGATTSEDGNRRAGQDKGEDDPDEDDHGGPSSEGFDDGRLGAGLVCGVPSVPFTKQELGRCAQRLIDQARAEWIREEFGFEDVKVVYYVGEEVTPQNALIIGTKEGGGGQGGGGQGGGGG